MGEGPAGSPSDACVVAAAARSLPGVVFEAETRDGSQASERKAELLRKIGELTVERDLSTGLGRSKPRETPSHGHSEASLSLRRQCELLGVSRCGLYYEPVEADAEALRLMRRIDELHLEHPFFGSRMLTQALKMEGWTVNRKRIQRLMRLMDLESLAPKPATGFELAAVQHVGRLVLRGSPMYRQRLRGVAMALSKVRGCLSTGLRYARRGEIRKRAVHDVLQQRSPTLRSWVPNANQLLRGREEKVRLTYIAEIIIYLRYFESEIANERLT